MKEFRLFLLSVQKLCDHAQPVFWTHPIFKGEIPKNGFFSMMLPFYVLATTFLQYKWYEGISFIFTFKTVRPRQTVFLATPYLYR